MRRKSTNWISIIIAFVLLLTGLYFDNSKIHSMFVCIPFETSDFQNVAEELIIADTQPCTAEMLGVRGHASTNLIAYRLSNQKRDIKGSLNFLCQNIDFSNRRKSYSSSQKIQMVSKIQEEFITNYIHNSDGKKRI